MKKNLDTELNRWIKVICLPSAAPMQLGNFQRSEVSCAIESHLEVSFGDFK